MLICVQVGRERKDTQIGNGYAKHQAASFEKIEKKARNEEQGEARKERKSKEGKKREK